MWKLVAAFIGLFLPKITYRVLAALGIAAFAVTGIDSASTFLYEKINQATQSGSSAILGMLSIAGIDVYITLIVSAYVSVFVYKSTFKVLGIKS